MEKSQSNSAKRLINEASASPPLCALPSKSADQGLPAATKSKKVAKEAALAKKRTKSPQKESQYGDQERSSTKSKAKVKCKNKGKPKGKTRSKEQSLAQFWNEARLDACPYELGEFFDMESPPVKASAPCPCGSGRKYGECCQKCTGIVWIQPGDDSPPFLRPRNSDDLANFFYLRFDQVIAEEIGVDISNRVRSDDSLWRVRRVGAEKLRRMGFDEEGIFCYQKVGFFLPLDVSSQQPLMPCCESFYLAEEWERARELYLKITPLSIEGEMTDLFMKVPADKRESAFCPRLMDCGLEYDSLLFGNLINEDMELGAYLYSIFRICPSYSVEDNFRGNQILRQKKLCYVSDLKPLSDEDIIQLNMPAVVTENLLFLTHIYKRQQADESFTTDLEKEILSKPLSKSSENKLIFEILVEEMTRRRAYFRKFRAVTVGLYILLQQRREPIFPNTSPDECIILNDFLQYVTIVGETNQMEKGQCKTTHSWGFVLKEDSMSDVKGYAFASSVSKASSLVITGETNVRIDRLRIESFSFVPGELTVMEPTIRNLVILLARRFTATVHLKFGPFVTHLPCSERLEAQMEEIWAEIVAYKKAHNMTK